MKSINLLIASIVLSFTILAQAPQTMSYQAVVRDSVNELLQNSPIGMKVTLLQGSASGSVVYVETHTATTNENALLSIQIGGGTVVSGTYHNGIFWGGGPYFIKTEIDPLGGTAYTITSTSELLSVPFSNYAHVSGILAGWSSDFVGAYKPISGTFIMGYATIYYLGFDKVALNVLIDEVNYNTQITYYGTVLGNTITFPNDNFGAYYGTAVKTLNSLELIIYDYDDFGNPVAHTAILEKQ